MKPYKNFGNLLNITKEKLNNINLFNEVETNYKDLITLCSPCHK